MIGISDYGTFCLAILVFLALPGPGTFTLLTSTAKGGLRAGATLGLIAGDLHGLLPALHRPSPTPGCTHLRTMALTIALITATYCLTLCACARLMTERVSANSKVALVLQRVAGLFLVGFGLRMIR